ncbi:MAG: hypothetical protein KC549_03075 [Myxococcales bacterium]|nr:hypothetical protein [Myxococcales bacterium]MCB9548251.1 hypothetical protein [Myxococcales bacterium]
MIPGLPAGHDARAAWIWFGFHLGRHLRRRTFWLWLVGIVGFLVLARGLAHTPARIVAQGLIIQLGPLLALFFCTGVIRQEIEDQTLTYGFSRPVGRGWLYMARVLATAAPVALLVLPGALYLGLEAGPQTAMAYGTATILAIAAYGGFFALIGQVFRWPAWFGLAFLLFWDVALGLVPGFLGKMTLSTHVRTVADLQIRLSDGPWMRFFEPPSRVASTITLLVFAAITLWLGGLLVRRREHRITR